MYALFRDAPTRKLGQATDPGLAYVKRQYQTLIKDVQNYYAQAPKYVESNNLFALIIQQFEIITRMDDAEWANHVERLARGVIPRLGIVSPINKGSVYTKGITLGPQAEEIAVASYEKFPTDSLGRVWRDLKPVRYLYHTRTDMMLPINNNSTPGRAFGVLSVNIPMLLIQYRYWRRAQIAQGVIQPENVYRFVGSILLPSLIDSFLDIAFFNRLDRQSQGITNPKFPSPHPFYITDLSDRLKKIEESINFEAILKGIEVEGLAAITPMIVRPNLFDVLKLPREPVTVQNQWALTMSRLPYIRYLVRMVMRNHGYDATQINAVMIDLIEGSNDQIFKQMGNTEFVKMFRKQITELIDDIKSKKN